MICADDDSLLRLVLGESLRGEAAVSVHVDACPLCTRRRAALEQTIVDLARPAGSPATDDETFVSRVVGAARRESDIGTAATVSLLRRFVAGVDLTRLRLAGVSVGGVALVAAVGLLLRIDDPAGGGETRGDHAGVTELLRIDDPAGGGETREDHAGVTEKGEPVLTTFVKRGEDVRAWDEQTPLRAGDRLRLRVQGAAGRYVTVLSVAEDGGRSLVLFAGRLASDGAALLPVSFRVDQRGRVERLDVIVAAGPVDPASRTSDELPPGAWRRRLTFAKETSR